MSVNVLGADRISIELITKKCHDAAKFKTKNRTFSEKSYGGRVRKKKTNFMAPFYGWGSTASRLEPLQGGSLLFTTKFPDIPGTHFIDLGRTKG